MAATQVRRILIKMDTEGSKAVNDAAKALGLLGKSAKSLSNDFGFLTNIFKGYLGLQSVKVFTDISDSMQNLENRLKNITTDGKSSADVLQTINDIAKRTYLPIADVGTSFARMGSAMANAKLNTEQLAVITETLIGTFKVSGSTGQEAAAVITQLSQSFSSGVVRGQELNSILEQNSFLAVALREKYKGVQGGLKQFAADGGLKAADILELMADNVGKLDTQLKNLSPTFQNTADVAQNDMYLAIHAVNKELKLSEKAFNAVAWATNNLGAIMAGLAAGGLALAAVKFSALSTAAGGLWAGILALGSNPLGWIAAAVISVTALVSAVGGLANAWDYIKIALLEVYERAAKLLTILYDVFLVEEIIQQFKDVWSGLSLVISTAYGYAKDFFLAVYDFSILKVIVEGIKVAVDGIVAGFKAAIPYIKQAVVAVKDFFTSGPAYSKSMKKHFDSVNSAQDSLLKDISARDAAALKKTEDLRKEQLLRDAADKLRSQETAAAGADKLSERMKLLNAEYRRTGDVEKYYSSLQKITSEDLDKRFNEGKISLTEYNKALNEAAIGALNFAASQGKISGLDYKTKLQALAQEELNSKFLAGSISLAEYNRQIIKLNEGLDLTRSVYDGLDSYYDSLGTLSENVASGISTTFGALETEFVNFVRTGQLNFKNLAGSILDELAKIIVRAAIIRPLVGGLLNNIGLPSGALNLGGGIPTTGEGAGFGMVAAKGAAFDNGIQKFAKGGVVDSPTMFGYGRGKRGLMGEAGTEAILPLSRAGNGDLGVTASVTPVTVNIYNQSGADVEQRETSGPNGERQIEILITSKMKDAFNTGKMDSIMKNQYGVNRKGA